MRHQARLRTGRVRRVRGAARRAAGAVVPGPRRRVRGRDVITVEGLVADGRLHPLQETFADLGAAQCGYCTPGFLVTAKALLDEHPATRRAIRSRKRSSGNLCRCTGYQQIFEAVEAAIHNRTINRAIRNRTDPQYGRSAMKIIGNAASPRRRAAPKSPARRVRRRHRAAADGALQAAAIDRARTRASSHRRVARARASRRACWSSPAATSRSPYGILPVSQDEHALRGRVRFVGDPVAAVVARDELTAFDALDLIDVEYEPLIHSPIPRRASPRRAAHPRLRRRRQHSQDRLAGIRRHRAGVRRSRSRLRGHLLLSGQHPPADGAARRGRGWIPTAS